jgi:hypothetical protein
VDRPDHVAGAVRDLQAALTDVAGGIVFTAGEVQRRHAGVDGYRHVHVHGAVRGRCPGGAGEIPRLVDVLLSPLQIAAVHVQERRPHQQAREERPLAEVPRQHDAALPQRDGCVPLADPREVLDPHLHRPQAEERGACLVGEPLAAIDVMLDEGRVAGETAEHGEGPVGRAGNAGVADLGRQPDRLLPVLPRPLRGARPQVEQEERTVRPRQQGRVSQVIGELQRLAHLGVRRPGVAQLLETHRLREAQPDEEGAPAGRLQQVDARLVPLQRLGVPAGPVVGEADAPLHGSSLLRRRVSQLEHLLPQGDGAVVLAEPLMRTGEVTDQVSGPGRLGRSPSRAARR